ncbi:MAG: DUF881 domain-containing protein [Clostridiaceae bacterium]|nr:DUF881 domain-containing protein [Eubacteriales bacterium]MDD4138661.1 DUF881 domain-containing protein [Eubacteriales bacterium]MDD4743249.1 DUF881 domain-containing protein [Eubacteriales bacterium]NLB43546.1 DUF881 domain-containing protein [Clostridiaceae bacterium]
MSANTGNSHRFSLRQQLMLFVVMLLFGFIVTNHVQSVRARSETRSLAVIYQQRERELNEQIKQSEVLTQENTALNQRKNELIGEVLVDQGYAELSLELERIRLLAGFTEVRGPGIVLTLNDKPDYAILKDSDASLVHDGDIRHALDLLRNAGVAALSVNDLRITNVSYIRCIGSTIRCNQYRMLPPFVIKALGDPAQLAEAIAGDPMFSMRQLPDIGLVVKVETVEEVVIPAFAESDRFGAYITLLEGN